MASITGENRDQGFIFSQETRQGLLATTQIKKFVLLTFITFINTISKKTFITYKKQEAKFETSVSNFSQETRKGATGGHAHKRNFASCFLFRNRLSMQIFIKIWYTENNIVKN